MYVSYISGKSREQFVLFFLFSVSFYKADVDRLITQLFSGNTC